MGIDDQLILEIIQRIRNVTAPDRIILFGSAALGNMNRDSDIDLLILEPNLKQERQEWLKIRNVLRGLGFPFDVILMTTQRFEDTKEIVGGIAFPANKYGRVIYDAS